jgi:stress response protein YsnF
MNEFGRPKVRWEDNTVTCPLKTEEAAVARVPLGKHASALTDMHTTIEELL